MLPKGMEKHVVFFLSMANTVFEDDDRIQSSKSRSVQLLLLLASLQNGTQINVFTRLITPENNSLRAGLLSELIVACNLAAKP